MGPLIGVSENRNDVVVGCAQRRNSSDDGQRTKNNKWASDIETRRESFMESILYRINIFAKKINTVIL